MGSVFPLIRLLIQKLLNVKICNPKVQKMNNKDLLLTAINAAFLAGEEILKIYGQEINVDYKDDNSPVTQADRTAHLCIEQFLKSTNLPMLSEEGKNQSFELRKKWERFWMIDPLDGTKEFIKRNGEFTVNIALIENQNPVLGVIWAPVKSLLYFGEPSTGAYRIDGLTTRPSKIEVLTKDKNKLPNKSYKGEFVVVASRSHLSSETEAFIDTLRKKHKNLTTTAMGSSLKLCLVAEGAANVYPRFAPTMEWDTAAGQAIVQASGKIVRDVTTNEPMRYNKKKLLNNWFIAE